MILLPIHITAALLALVAGAVAMVAAKGGNLHRKSGMAFVICMLVMSSTGATIAAMEQNNRGSMLGGVLTFYLVSTGLLTVRREVGQVRGLLTALMLVALTASAFEFRFGIEALHSATGTLDRIPAPAYLLFGAMGLMAGLLDARMLLAGSIHGAHRLARHLWRMSFAMWIATSSFFLGQPKVFPEVLRKNFCLRAIPVLLVVVFLIYWLVRVLWKRRSMTAVPSS